MSLRVDDGRGRSDLQTFVLTVSGDPNHPPYFTTTPVVDAVVLSPYSYPSHAADPDFDPVHYALATFPAGLTINGTTGVISWTPTAAQLGLNPVVIVADDGRGGTATQSYQILVGEPKGYHPPIIVSTPETVYRSPAGPQGSTSTLLATIRDFRADYTNFEGGITGVVTGIVAPLLGPDNTPVYVGPPGAGSIVDAAAFDTFYHDVPGLNESTTYPIALTETTPTSGNLRVQRPAVLSYRQPAFRQPGEPAQLPLHDRVARHLHLSRRRNPRIRRRRRCLGVPQRPSRHRPRRGSTPPRPARSASTRWPLSSA